MLRRPIPLVDHEGNPYVEAVDDFGTLDWHQRQNSSEVEVPNSPYNLMFSASNQKTIQHK
jgi:hypothetical protein